MERKKISSSLTTFINIIVVIIYMQSNYTNY